MHKLHSKCVHSEGGGNWHNGKTGIKMSWLRDDNMMLICKTVGNMDTNMTMSNALQSANSN